MIIKSGSERHRKNWISISPPSIISVSFDFHETVCGNPVPNPNLYRWNNSCFTLWTVGQIIRLNSVRPLSDWILREPYWVGCFLGGKTRHFPQNRGDEAGESKNHRRRKTRKDGSRSSFQNSQAERFAGLGNSMQNSGILELCKDPVILVFSRDVPRRATACLLPGLVEPPAPIVSRYPDNSQKFHLTAQFLCCVPKYGRYWS